MPVQSKMQAPKSLQFMWTDSWFDGAARQNPLRWGTCSSGAELLEQLTAGSNMQHRPVRIHAEMEDGRVEKEFEDTLSAVKWIRQRLPCEKVAVAAPLRSAPTPHELVGSQEPEAMELAIDASDAAASQEHTASLRYMWADAGLLPVAPMQTLAKANPLRWSPSKSPDKLVKALEQAQLYWPERAVMLEGNMPGEHVVKTFPNIDAAIRWIRDELNVPEEPTTTPEEHRCVICLDAQVTVMLMPCRHAVLCDDCAKPMLEGRAPCPICRAPIQNHAHGRFASDYVDLVEAIDARMEGAARTMHDGMYNHVKPLMLTGALLGTGAAVCFVACPPAAPALAAGAFAVGYVPWFATTVAHFEREDHSEAGALRAPMSFFTQDDLSQPLKLIGKVVVMGVFAPIAAVAFFIPYGLYRCVLKPAAKALLQALVRVSAFAHVYAVRPTGEALQALGRGLAELVCQVGGATRDLALVIADMLVSVAAGTHTNLLEPIGRFLYNYALIPCVNGVQVGSRYAAECIAAGAQVTYDNAVLPAAQGIRQGAEFLYTHALVPLGECVRWMLQHLADALAYGATSMYTYVLAPCGRVAAKAIVDGLALTADGACYVLPIIGRNLASAAAATYSYALVPLAGALAAGAQTVYVYALAPCGRALYTAGAATAAGISAVARTVGEYSMMGAQVVYAYILLPCGQVLAVVFTTVGGAIGSCAAVTAPAVAACATATGAAAQACGQEMMNAASAVHTVGRQAAHSMGVA